MNNTDTRIITGFHAIEETLRAGAFTSEGGKAHLLYANPGPRVKKILADAKKRGIPCKESTAAELNRITADLQETAQEHRGIVLIIEGAAKSEQNIVQFDAVLAQLREKESAIVVMLDSVTDPHNVGAIIRSADQFGADLVVIPERRGVSEGEVVSRSSAGASAWVATAVVPNLCRAAEQLKEAGFWIYGADAGGTPAHKQKLTGKTAIVMGSEGSGIGRLLKEKCDAIVSIPTCGKLDSLNVSVAAGVLLYEVRRQALAENGE